MFDKLTILLTTTNENTFHVSDSLHGAKGSHNKKPKSNCRTYQIDELDTTMMKVSR